MQPSIEQFAQQTLSLPSASPAAKQVAQNHLNQLCLHENLGDQLEALANTLCITAFVDGRGLSCPMPLLKTKVALRSVAVGESVYVIATDANTSHDIVAFCQKHAGANLDVTAHTVHAIHASHTHQTTVEQAQPELSASTDDLEKLDTIFHFIITKTHGN